jgi:hypothetical protein
LNFFVLFSVAERAMHWQDRVRQALKQKDVEMALLEFSMYQQKKDAAKDPQDRKVKRSKVKKESADSSAQLTPSSSDAGSDTGNVSDNDVEMKLS